LSNAAIGDAGPLVARSGRAGRGARRPLRRGRDSCALRRRDSGSDGCEADAHSKRNRVDRNGSTSRPWLRFHGQRPHRRGRSGDQGSSRGSGGLDARGKVTPGIIDRTRTRRRAVARHRRHHDTNRQPIRTAGYAEHSVWPEDPGERAVAGGVTTIAVLPGSANLVGGRA
jgi:hypothetical protein